MIWDAHSHFSDVIGDTLVRRMAPLPGCADRMGIERLYLSMGMNWSHHPSPEDLRKRNDEVLLAVKEFPQTETALREWGAERGRNGSDADG